MIFETLALDAINSTTLAQRDCMRSENWKRERVCFINPWQATLSNQAGLQREFARLFYHNLDLAINVRQGAPSMLFNFYGILEDDNSSSQPKI